MTKLWIAYGAVFLSLLGGVSGVQGALPLPGTPTPEYPDSGSVIKDLSFSFGYTGENALWHNVYFQRNGSLFRSLWNKAYEEPWENSYGTVDSEDVVGPDNNFPAGNYKWWVRGWNATGYGPWSTTNMTFTVPVIPLGKPTPLQPTGTNTTFVWFAFRSTNVMVKWCNVLVYRNNLPYTNIWDRVWRKGDRYVWLSDGESLPQDPRWPAGNYRWWVREWSPVSGTGPWSDGMPFTVQSAAVPKPATGLDIDTTGFYSGTRPRFSLTVPDPDPGLEQTASATWIYLWINRNGAIYSRDIFRRDGDGTCDEGGMMDSDLPAGRYDWWIQLMNSKGNTAFIKGASFTNTPAAPAIPVLKDVKIGDGSASMVWTLQRGIYWYQVWVTRDNATYATKWCSFMNDWGYIYDDGDWNQHMDIWVESETNANLDLTALDPGSYKVWVKAQGPAGTRWSSAVSFTLAGRDAWDPADNVRSNGTVLVPLVDTLSESGPHILSPVDTEDWFQISMAAGTFYHLATAGGDWTSCGYRLYNTAGDKVDAGYLDAGDWGSSQIECTETGLYYLQIKYYDAGKPWADPMKAYTLQYWSESVP